MVHCSVQHNSIVATVAVAASTADNTVDAGAFLVFVVCIVSCIAFTPDSADIADDVVAIVAIFYGTIVVVATIVVADDVDATVCGGVLTLPFCKQQHKQIW